MASNSPMANVDGVTTARRVGTGVHTAPVRGARREERKEEEAEEVAAAAGRPDVRRTTATLCAKAACISAKPGGGGSGWHARAKRARQRVTGERGQKPEGMDAMVSWRSRRAVWQYEV